MKHTPFFSSHFFTFP
ncbi:pheA operon leader peptide PheL [Escherichia coli]|nr:pheA operon leader peptide PheL [Escherichia coli]